MLERWMNLEHNRLLTSKVWRHKRKAILERDGHRCAFCGSDAVVVHHIFPLDDHPEFCFEDWNLISLCKSCHNRIEVGSAYKGLRGDGLKLLRETAMKRGIEIPEKYRNETT